jgi:hypothetical protein
MSSFFVQWAPLTLHRRQEVQHRIFWNILETCAPTTIPCIQWTKQLACINWKKCKGYNNSLEAVGIYRAKRPLPKKILMIRGRYHKKKTIVKFERHFEKQNAHHSGHSIFWNAPTDSGKKSLLCKERSNYTRKLGAGLYAVMLPNRTGTPKCNTIRVIDINWASHIYI